MKKSILFLSLLFCLDSKAGVVIDSISEDTVCAGSFLRVYTHTIGTITPSQSLVLYFNASAVISGTYQQLIDSNYVWGFVVTNITYPGYDTHAGMNIAGGQLPSQALWFKYCNNVGVEEQKYSGKILSVKYMSVLGVELIEVPVNQIVIKETRYTSGTRRESVIVTD